MSRVTAFERQKAENKFLFPENKFMRTYKPQKTKLKSSEDTIHKLSSIKQTKICETNRQCTQKKTDFKSSVFSLKEIKISSF